VYIFGGSTGLTGDALATTDVVLYENTLDICHPKLAATLPAPLRAAAGLRVPNGIIIAGGLGRETTDGTSGLSTAVYLFDLGESSFTLLSPLPSASAYAEVAIASLGNMGRAFTAMLVGGLVECSGGAASAPAALLCQSNQVQLLTFTP
jgi:hypothetical protein